MGDECLQDMSFFLMVLRPVEMKHIIQPDAMCARYHAVNRNISLQGTGCSKPENLQQKRPKLSRSPNGFSLSLLNPEFGSREDLLVGFPGPRGNLREFSLG